MLTILIKSAVKTCGCCTFSESVLILNSQYIHLRYSFTAQFARWAFILEKHSEEHHHLFWQCQTTLLRDSLWVLMESEMVVPAKHQNFSNICWNGINISCVCTENLFDLPLGEWEFKLLLMHSIPMVRVGSERKSSHWHMARIYSPAAVIMFILHGESVK